LEIEKQKNEDAAMEMTSRDIRIMKTLNKYPEIKDDVDELCQIAEAAHNELKLADDAEDMVVEDIRKLGAKVLTRWAEGRADKESLALEQAQPVHKHGKKK
jgi:hypothetical protein